jgi:hypothetical protein
MADNDTMQSNPASAMVAGFRRQVETCRKVADLMLDTTGRLEQIGLKVARSALHGSLDAAVPRMAALRTWPRRTSTR